jgi:uncharacterized protein (DUF362 family)
MNTAVLDFVSYEKSVTAVLDRLGADNVLAGQSKILIKPNLVTALAFPVTTTPECCGAIIDYIRRFNHSARIIIAEGTGDPGYSTMDVFKSLGYVQLAAQKNVKLKDLNSQPLCRLENQNCKRLPEYFLPEIGLSHYIISVPVLKVHTLAGITGTMKNMMGFAPPSHYAGGGSWNKSSMHKDLQQAIIDLNRHRAPDLSVIDASAGLADSHLGGRQCNPLVKKIIAGFDPVDVDRTAAGLLGLKWEEIAHLRTTDSAQV